MARTSKVGVNGRNADRFEEADFQIVREAKLESIKMMSQTSVEDFQRLKAENPNLEIITRLQHSDLNSGGHPSPEAFVNTVSPIIARLQPYCTQFQIANEPNHVHRYEGWGATDDDARNFNEWFLDVYARLKQLYPWASFGFPGLAIPDDLHRDKAWLQICRPAIERADWLGCHSYWQTPPNGGSVMMADHSGLSFKYYHELYPNKLIHILECGNSNGQGQGFSTDEGLYAEEYQKWLNEVFQYPYIGSTAFFILSSPDPVWDSFAWRTNGTIKNRIVGGIGNMGRPELSAAQLGQPAITGGQPTTNTPPPQLPSAQVGIIPAIFTHQNLIDAFYNAAALLGVGNWDVLNKTGLDVAQLAQDRPAIYQGAALTALPGLSDLERSMVAVELIKQMRKTKKTTGVINAPAGLKLRNGPGTDQAELKLLSHQTPLDVMSEAGEWLFVATNEGDAGYAHASYIVRADAAPQPVAVPAAQPVAQPVAGGSWAMAGYFASMPELISTALAPAAAEQIALGATAGPGARLLANIWNRYGGLLNPLAAKLGIDPAVAVAVLAVESGGNAFGADGRMIIRFENHLFYSYWGKQNPDRFAQYFTFNDARCWEGHTWRSDPNQPFQEFHGNQAAEWAALNFAASLDESAAKSSISMGLPQIMGFNHKGIGYASVQDMFNAFQADERNHVLGLFDFINASPNMVQALRSQNYAGFAAGYNGTGQADYYGGLILKWVQSFGILRQDPSSASFSYQDSDAPVLASDLDAAISFLPMPQPSAVFMQVTAPQTTVAQATVPQTTVATAPATAATTAPATTTAATTVEPVNLPPIAQPVTTMDNRLYDLWLEHIKHGFENNNIMFNRVLRAFMIPYYMTIAMYVVMFAVGIGLFVVATRLSSQPGTQVAGYVFGGLGIASFLGYFMSKPLRSLEENLQFITWLGIVYNSYWTRLLYMQNATSIQADLKEATTEAVTQIEQMLNKNVEVAYKRPEPKEGK